MRTKQDAKLLLISERFLVQLHGRNAEQKWYKFPCHYLIIRTLNYITFSVLLYLSNFLQSLSLSLRLSLFISYILTIVFFLFVVLIRM
jgi:hypothetical protein